MKIETLRAIAEMIRCAARAEGFELTDVDITLCRSVDPLEMLERMEERDADA
ncbi:MAG: hypothetical protein ABL959_14655 [Pyrinomonadaceae bacterium]